jgi:choline monooxygenase
MHVSKKIREASTLPGRFYHDQDIYRRSLETVFARSWQFLGHHSQWQTGMQYPHTLLPGCLNEPLIISVDVDGHMGVCSNVCTHRGFILLEEPRETGSIRCRYHGRCFHANGQFKSMPEFEEAEHFPSPKDDLHKPPHYQWQGFHFASVFPHISGEEVFAPLTERLGFFAFDQLEFRSDLSHDYEVKAHWALYCDNYLEGFHIPFVHQSLNKVIDYGQYETLIFDWCNLQIGIGKPGEPVFDLPADSPDYGKQVAAYYFWVFPNLMINVYPWGISMNVVMPQGPDKTLVRFLTYVGNAAVYNTGAGSDLHRVEMEDEEVVESVHRGLASRLYQSGRFSPTMERGVHHFHGLLAGLLGQDA